MDDRRGAQRLAIPKPVAATFGGFAANILEISLIGCQIEHTDRITPKARLPLKFKWRGAPVKIEATVIRSEMRSVRGKAGYASGLEFCKSPDDAPAVVREIFNWLAKATAAPAPVASAPAPAPVVEEEDAEVMSADYLQCLFERGQWTMLYVDDPQQPRDGFTIPAPADDAEANVLCRAYEKADAAKRRAMRDSFELAIKRQRRA
jgi:PilZ domain-containing protein